MLWNLSWGNSFVMLFRKQQFSMPRICKKFLKSDNSFEQWKVREQIKCQIEQMIGTQEQIWKYYMAQYLFLSVCYPAIKTFG